MKRESIQSVDGLFFIVVYLQKSAIFHLILMNIGRKSVNLDLFVNL